MTGLVVTAIDPSSPAAEAGLQRGDVIQKVNRQPVATMSDFDKILAQGAGKPVLLLVNRGGQDSVRCRGAGQISPMSRQQHHIFLFAQALGEAVVASCVDIYRTPSGWLLKFDLAGVTPEDIAVSVSGRRITVRGVRRDEVLEQGCSYYRMEIAYCGFERSVDLPCSLKKHTGRAVQERNAPDSLRGRGMS